MDKKAKITDERPILKDGGHPLAGSANSPRPAQEAPTVHSEAPGMSSKANAQGNVSVSTLNQIIYNIPPYWLYIRQPLFKYFQN